MFVKLRMDELLRFRQTSRLIGVAWVVSFILYNSLLSPAMSSLCRCVDSKCIANDTCPERSEGMPQSRPEIRRMRGH